VTILPLRLLSPVITACSVAASSDHCLVLQTSGRSMMSRITRSSTRSSAWQRRTSSCRQAAEAGPGFVCGSGRGGEAAVPACLPFLHAPYDHVLTHIRWLSTAIGGAQMPGTLDRPSSPAAFIVSYSCCAVLKVSLCSFCSWWSSRTRRGRASPGPSRMQTSTGEVMLCCAMHYCAALRRPCGAIPCCPGAPTHAHRAVCTLGPL